MRSVVYDPDALKTFRRLPRNVSERIRAKLAQLAFDPDSLANNLSALKGTSALRLRIGDCVLYCRSMKHDALDGGGSRINAVARLLEVADGFATEVTVHQIGSRGSVYC